VSVTKTGTGKGIITGANNSINCGTTCPSQSIQVDAGDSFYVISTADTNSTFQSLSIQPSIISCSTGSSNAQCYITSIKQDISFTTDFKLNAPATYFIDAKKAGSVDGSVGIFFNTTIPSVTCGQIASFPGSNSCSGIPASTLAKITPSADMTKTTVTYGGACQGTPDNAKECVITVGSNLVTLPNNGIEATVTFNPIQGFSCSNIAEIPASECQVLESLYKNTNGFSWAGEGSTGNWLKTKTPCTNWAGIVCSNGHVTEINRSGSNVYGFLPDLSGLPFLKKIDFSYNSSLTGVIPDLSQLTKLEYVELYFTGLTGSFPNFGANNVLTYLRLGLNKGLTGSIPLSVKNITSLKTFSVHDTGFCRIDNAEFVTWMERLYVATSPWSLPVCGGTTTCSLSLSSSTASHNAIAEPGFFNISSVSCDWTMSNNATWLKPALTSGNSPRTINYTVDANTTTQTRTGVLTITAGQATQTFTVTQAGTSPAQCNQPTFSLASNTFVVKPNLSFSLGGTVNAASGDMLKEVHINVPGQTTPISSGAINQTSFDLTSLMLPGLPRLGGSFPLPITAKTANCTSTISKIADVFPVNPPTIENFSVNGITSYVTISQGNTVSLAGLVKADNGDVLKKLTLVIGRLGATTDDKSTFAEPLTTSFDLSRLTPNSSLFSQVGAEYLVGVWAAGSPYSGTWNPKPPIEGTGTQLASFKVKVAPPSGTGNTGNFRLKFPLKGYDPISVISKGNVSSYFDHAMPLINGKYYTYAEGTNSDDSIINFKGVKALRGNGFARNSEGKVWTYPANGFILHGYKISSGGQLFYSGHPGYDYAIGAVPVFAAADGVVVAAGSNGKCHCASNCGSLGIVEIQHQDGYLTCYMHMTGINTSLLNKQVTGGVTQLGIQSNVAPQAMGVHLHFEVRKNNIPVDPYGWLGQGADPYTRATNVWLWETPQPNPSSLAVTTLAGIGTTAAIGGGVSSDGINFLKNGIFSAKDSLMVALTINPDQADITNSVMTRRNALTSETTSVTDSLPEAEPVLTEGMELPETNTARTAPEIIGNNALYIVANYEGIWFYKKGEEWKQWDGTIGNLEPYINNITLSPTEEVDVIKGLSGFAGTFAVFAGYRNATGNIIFNQEPITFTVTP
jgi:murein DD-endopeptidase MepM/ murein hydrolase activator NlpD